MQIDRAAGHAPAPVTPRPGRTGLRRAAALGLAALLAGCASRPPPAKPGPRVYAIDLQGGAKRCTVRDPKLTDGKTSDVAMTVGNDGGWCAIQVSRPGDPAEPQPYAAGLLTTPAAHGRVYIHTVGAMTRIDYTPNAGFVGTDRFTVTLLPGRPAIVARVTVLR